MARRPHGQQDDTGQPAPNASVPGQRTCIPALYPREKSPRRDATRLSRLDLAALFGSSLVPTLVFALVLRRQLAYYLPGATTRPTWGNDYPVHAYIAQQWMDTGQPGVPHFLYELLSIVVHTLVPSLSLLDAGQIVAISSFALSGFVIYPLIRFPLTPDAPPVRPVIAALLVIGVQLLAPVVFFSLRHRNLYLGYIPTNVYHNPTIVLLHPLALLLALQSLRIFDTERASPCWATASASGLLVVLSTLAKPSYAICLLPGLALFCAWKSMRGEPVDWRLTVVGFFVPLLLMLGFQYVMHYHYARALPASIEIAPFYFFQEILRLFGKPTWLVPKLALSILFPVVVLLLHAREALRSVPLMLSWIVFGVGAFYTYFVVESGPGRLDGNFTWSGQISLYIVFVMSLMFFLDQGGLKRLTRRSLICLGVFGLHVVSGVIWAWRQASPHANEWW